jgi:hypothetical protein
MLVMASPQTTAQWVAARCGSTAPTVDAAIGFVEDGQMTAAVYFDCFTGRNIFAHIASDRAVMPRSLLSAVAVYVYFQLGLDRMTFAVDASNRAAVRLVESFGAVLEGSLRGAGAQSDLLVFALWRDARFTKLLLGDSR